MKIVFKRAFGRGIKINEISNPQSISISVAGKELKPDVDYYIEDMENKDDVEIVLDWLGMSVHEPKV